MIKYNANSVPVPEEWLALEEEARVKLIQEYLEESGDFTGENAHLHACMQAIVENQIAADDPPATAQAVKRLMKEGLERQNALHAVAYALNNELFFMHKNGKEFSTTRYRTNLNKLSARKWLSGRA